MHQAIEPLDRETTPETPGRSSYNEGHLYFMEGYQAPQQDPPIDSRTALSYATVWACKQFISQTIASLGWHVFERSEDRRSRKPIEDDVAWMLGMQASPEMNAFEWRQVMLMDALDGNAFAEIERTNSGRPTWLHRICPSRVTLYRDDLKRLLYEVRNEGADPTYFRPEDIFHLRGPSPDGLVGYSVIQMFRRSIGLGVSTERYQRTFFDRGPMPGGTLTVPSAMKKEARDELRESFQSAYGGSRNAGKVIVLWGDMAFAPATQMNRDAQLQELRDMNAYEVCRIYRVPPHKVGLLARSTNNNIEHQGIEAVQDCVLPWARRLEMEADVKLYGRVTRGRRYTRLNLGTLMRGDSAAQTQSVKEKVNAGLMTPNEGREYLDLDPKEGGDVLLVQGAMTTLDRVINPPEPPAPKPPPGGGGDTEGGDGEQDGATEEQEKGGGAADDRAAPFRLLLARQFAALLRVEADKARRAANKGKLAEHVAEFYGESNAGHIRDAIRPILEGLCYAVGAPAEEAAAWAERLAKGTDLTSSQQLRLRGVEACEGWLALAEGETAHAVNSIIRENR